MTRSERERPLARFHAPFKTRSYYLSVLYIRPADGSDRPPNRRVIGPEGCAPPYASVEYPALSLGQHPWQMLLSILLSSS
jgi:hypothetical protein